jgi:putative Holliday junction resolvase
MITKKLVGIDFGLKRIGIALSDSTAVLAFPYKEIKAGKTPEQSAENVWIDLQKEMVVKQFDIHLFVIGLPKTMKGEIKERALQVELFAKTLELLSSKPVQYIDERLSTVQAERSLKELSLTRKQRSKHIDEVSAALILQSHLDLHRK